MGRGKGSAYHQGKKPKAIGSFRDGWLAGLAGKYERGLITKEHYQDSVTAYKRYSRRTDNATYSYIPHEAKKAKGGRKKVTIWDKEDEPVL